MPVGELRQAVTGVVAVGGEQEAAVGEPVAQHRQQLPQQFPGGFVPPAVGAVPLLGAIQGDQDRQGPRAPGEGELHQQGQHDPLVPPTEGGVAVGRAHGVAVAALAVDLFAFVLGHGVVAGHGHRAAGEPAAQQVAGQGPPQAPDRPGAPGEDAVIAGGVARGEGPHGAQQVQDGPPAGGQDGRQQQHHEALVRRAAEGSREGLQQGAADAPQGVGQRRRPAGTAAAFRLAALAAPLLGAAGVLPFPSVAASG